MKTSQIIRNLFLASLVFIVLACSAKKSEMASREADNQTATSMATEAKITDEENAQADTLANSILQEEPQKLQDKSPSKSPSKVAEKQISGETNAFDTLADLRLPRKRFIKTASIRGSVANIVVATEKTENLIKSYGGFVTNSNLQNVKSYANQVALSKDTTLLINRLNAQAFITASIPQQHLDSALRQLVRLFLTVEDRKLTAQDVSITLLDDKMKAFSNYQSQKRLQKASQQAGNKLEQVVEAEDAIVARQLAAIQSQIANLRLNDRIVYAAVEIAMTQPEEVQKTKIFNAYQDEKSPFLYQFTQAFGNGWELCQEIFLFFVSGWSVWLLLIGFVVLYLRYVKPFFAKKK
jgi:hypothetical protein